MKKIILILILINNYLFAEDILKEFISSPSLTLKEIKNLKQNFSKDEFDNSILKKLRLNMNYSKLDKGEIDDEYEARIYPKSFSQIDIEEKIYNLKKGQINSIYEENYLKLLKEKYLLIFEIYFKRKEYILIQKTLELKQKKLNITSQNLEAIGSVFDIAKLKREILDLKFELKEKKSNYENMLLYLKSFIPKYNTNEIDKTFENFHFMRVSKLLNYVKKNENNFLENIDKSLKLNKSDLKLAQNEKKLKELENSFRINSVDIKYENDKDLNRAFTLGVSLEFRFSKSDDMKEKLNILKAKSELELKKNNLNYQIFTLIKNIKNLSEKFLYYKDSIENDTFYDTYLKLQNPDPLTILDLKYNHLKIEKEMINLEYKLYGEFINLFYITNNLNEDILSSLRSNFGRFK